MSSNEASKKDVNNYKGNNYKDCFDFSLELKKKHFLIVLVPHIFRATQQSYML